MRGHTRDCCETGWSIGVESRLTATDTLLRKENTQVSVNESMPISVDDIIKQKNRFEIEFSYPDDLEYLFNFSTLKYEYDVDISDIDESLLLVPFVGNMIPMIWLHGVRVEVPSLDSTFFNQLPNVKKSLDNIYPMVEFDDSGEVIPDNLHKNEEAISESSEKSAQLFTGGVDALATYVRHQDESPALISIDADLWRSPSDYEQRQERISTFANKENVEYHPISTNMYWMINQSELEEEFEDAVFLSWWTNFQLSLSYLTACTPISVSENYSKIRIASTASEDYDYKHASYPTTDNNIRWSNMCCKHDSFDLNRQEKWKEIINNYGEKNRNVLVKSCQENELYNCNQCLQCIRNIISLSIEDANMRKFGHEIEQGWYDNIKKRLCEGDTTLKGPDVFIMGNMQSYVPESIPSSGMSSERAQFLSWFQNLELSEYCDVDECKLAEWRNE